MPQKEKSAAQVSPRTTDLGYIFSVSFQQAKFTQQTGRLQSKEM